MCANIEYRKVSYKAPWCTNQQLKKKVLKTRDDITLKILGGCSGKTLSTTPAYYTRLYGR